MIQMCFVQAERQLVEVVDHSTVAYVEVRVTALRPEIKRVARESAVTGSRRERVGRIVDRMRERIRSADLQAVPHPLANLYLQAVVSRVRNRLLQERLDKSIIIYSVKREIAEFGTDPQLRELQSPARAFE